MADVVHTDSERTLSRDEICLFSEELDGQIHKQRAIMCLGKKKKDTTTKLTQYRNETYSL